MRIRNLVLSLAAALAATAGAVTAIGTGTARAGDAETSACRFTLERGPAGKDRDGRTVENWIVTCNHVAPRAADATPLQRGLPSLQVMRPDETPVRSGR
jgi:hypothetical protein